MSQNRQTDDEQRFNTANLLKDVQASDVPLDEIMSEFGSLTVKPAPLTAGGKPHVEDSRSAAYADADTIWASLEAEIRADLDADRAARQAAATAQAEKAAGRAPKKQAQDRQAPQAGTAGAAQAEKAAGRAPKRQAQDRQAPQAGTAGTAQAEKAAGRAPKKQAQDRQAPQTGTAGAAQAEKAAGRAPKKQAQAPQAPQTGTAGAAQAEFRKQNTGAEAIRASRSRFVDLELQQQPRQTAQAAGTQAENSAGNVQKAAAQTGKSAGNAQKAAAQAGKSDGNAQKAAAQTGKSAGNAQKAAADRTAADTQKAGRYRPTPTPAPDSPLPGSPVPETPPAGQPYGDAADAGRRRTGAAAVRAEAERSARAEEKKQKKQKKPAEPASYRPEPSPAAALRSCSSSLKTTRARLMPALVLSILAGILTLAAACGWSLLTVFETPFNRNLVLIALQVLTMLLCFDLIAQGISSLLHLRFAMPALVLLSACLILIDGLLNLQEAAPPLCAVSCFALTITLQSSSQEKLARRRSLKILAASETPTDLRCVSGIRDGGPCLLRIQGVQDGFITDMEKPDRTDTVLGVYGPILLAGTLLAALLLQARLEMAFLRIWCILICAGIPMAGAVCFSRPWSLLSGRLARSGAAVAGWHGAQVLGGADAAVILDEDIYPAGSVRLSGMKLFEPFRAELVTGYAASLILPLGGSLAEPFRQLQEEQGAQIFEPTGLRAYEGGGIGGDIRGDVVLAGSMSFMQLMGIRVPRNASVRQAVYLAINGELAGLFAISWQKSRSVQRALRAMAREPSCRILFAIRDFLMSPALLRQQFGLAAESIEYPRVEVRLALSGQQEPGIGIRGAILTRNNLTACSETVCGAAQLRRTTRRNLALCIVGGIAGAAAAAAALPAGMAPALLALLELVYGLVWYGILSLSSLFVNRF